jgi:hypothetical protein
MLSAGEATTMLRTIFHPEGFEKMVEFDSTRLASGAPQFWADFEVTLCLREMA